MKLSKSFWLALIAILAVFAASCGSDDESSTDAGASDAAADDSADDAPAEEAPLPGEGKSVNMGRANWSSGYVHAQILHDLLEEIGYDVSRPDAQ